MYIYYILYLYVFIYYIFVYILYIFIYYLYYILYICRISLLALNMFLVADGFHKSGKYA